MVPGIYDFKTQKAGDTFNGLQLTCTITSNGSTDPIDLTAVDIRLYVRKAVNCPTILQLDNSGANTGITVTDGLNGVLRIDPFTVPSVPSFKYRYDMEFTYSTGVIKTYLKGDFPIEEDITK